MDERQDHMSVSNGEFRSFAAARLDPLYRAAILLTGQHQAAEDLVQETLTRMYVAWHSRRLDDPVAYSRATLVNTFISGRRRRSSSEYPHAVVPDAVAPTADVDVRVDVQRALGELKAIDRAIVVMRYLEDVPVDDVAAALRISPGNVRVRATRALASLRTSLPLRPAESMRGEDTHD
jgi:RNA polymerase sigma-70 factor (sigma-E family)